MILLDPFLAGPSLLLVLGTTRRHRHQELARAIGSHGVLPARLRQPLSRVLPVVEIVVGILGLAASFTARQSAVTWAGSLLVLSFGGFSLYAVLAVRAVDGRAQSVPCGCVGPSDELSRFTVIRPALAGCSSLVGATTDLGRLAPAYSVPISLLILCILYFGPWLVAQ